MAGDDATVAAVVIPDSYRVTSSLRELLASNGH
jgi:hypothetical protein